MIYKETIPSNIPEGVWDEKSCVRRQSGFTIDQSKLPATLKWLSKGAPLALNSNGKVVLCKTAKVYENATKSATEIKVDKNHNFMVGDTIAGSAISAIDSSNENFDKFTIAALAEKADKGAVLDDGNASNVVGLNYATVELDGMQSCTPTLQAYEIEEDTLPYYLNDAIKTALTSRHAFKL
jgi:hypothetical protein